MQPTRAVVTVLTIVLAIATAVTLVGTAVTLADTPSGSSREDENLAVVRRFYAAVNAALATGELGSLDAVVSPDFIVGEATAAGARGLPALSDHLQALHAARPALWVRIEEAIADGDQVVVRVAFDGLDVPAGPDGLIAVPAPDSSVWAAGDRFRLAEGRIVAYDGLALALAPGRTVLDAVVEPPAIGRAWLGLARLTVVPGASATAPAGTGPATYLVEAGIVAIRLAGPDGVLGEERRLIAGDQVDIPVGVSFALRNPSTAPATLLAAGLVSAGAPWPPRFDLPQANPIAAVPPELRTQFSQEPALKVTALPPVAVPVASTSLGRAQVVPGRLGLSGPIRLGVSRLEPAPGRTLLSLAGAGPALLTAEVGQALVSASDAAADLVSAEAQVVPAAPGAAGGGSVVLTDGRAALSEGGGSIAVQATGEGPLALLVLTLGPA
jgi:hypothetical protein